MEGLMEQGLEPGISGSIMNRLQHCAEHPHAPVIVFGVSLWELNGGTLKWHTNLTIRIAPT